MLEQELTSKIQYYTVDDDAFVNPEDKKYVVFLSVLDESGSVYWNISNLTMSILESVSIRLKNGVKYYLGMRNFLVNYLYAKDSKLLGVKNCGRKSIHDLNKVNAKGRIKDYIKELFSKTEEGKYTEQIIADAERKNVILDGFSIEERYGKDKAILIHKKCEQLLKGCSVRVRNAINGFNKTDDIAERMLSSTPLDVKSIKNLGKHSEIELQQVKAELVKFADSLGERELSQEEMQLFKAASIFGKLIDDFVPNYLKENHHLPMLHIVGNAMRRLIVNRNYGILNGYTPFFEHTESYTRESLAQKYNLTKERVRQIIEKTRKQIGELENEIAIQGIRYKNILLDESAWKYLKEALQNKECVVISDILSIIKDEECGLSNDFVMLVIAVLLRNDYHLVGKSPLRQDQCLWKGTYLIKKELSEAFEFGKIIDALKSLAKENFEDKPFRVEEILVEDPCSLWKIVDFSMLDSVAFIVKEILTLELSMIPNIDGQYILEGKKVREVGDVVFEFLTEKGVPVSVENILKRLNEEFPNKYKTKTSLYNVLKRDGRFGYISQSKEYGLLKWDDVQYGSIRDVIVSYLSESDEPKTLTEITKFVLKHRNSNETSIRSSMETGDQFYEVSRGLYGLTGRSYEDWKRRKWFDTCSKCFDFIRKQHRKPAYAIGELELSDWFKEAKKDFKEGNLTPDQTKNFVELCNIL